MARIVVIDDVPDAARLVRRVLEECGHEVLEFTEGSEALEFFRHHGPDLVVLDLRLKQMDGVEVLEQIRKCAPATRVVVLTGSPTVEARRKALRLGASAFCTKPIDNEDLVETIGKVLDGDSSTAV